MRLKGPVRLVPVILTPAFVLGAAAARAETTQCTPVTSLPAVITVQGVYCLTGDLSISITSGIAIEIAANNVVLDLNGHKIGGLGAGLGTTVLGIVAYSRQNVTIKNGSLRGFLVGIYLYDSFFYTTSQGHVIEDIRADQNTFVGFWTMGRGLIIRNNLVVATGGTTSRGPEADAYAMVLSGFGN